MRTATKKQDISMDLTRSGLQMGSGLLVPQEKHVQLSGKRERDSLLGGFMKKKKMQLNAYSRRSGIHNKKKFASVEDKSRKDKVYLYCKSSIMNDCEVHIPTVFIPDAPVPMGVANRARQTLPVGLEVQKSSIPDSGMGVFNKGDTVPAGAHFGPYQGELVDREEAMNSAYSWVISKSRQCKEYVDGTREMYANWMRYVNCARNEDEKNLVAFQCRDGILYRCCQTINPGQELLVWYEEEYAKDLGVMFHSLWKKKCSRNKLNNASLEVFSCTLCSLCYTGKIYLHKHMKRCHYEEYVRLQKSGEINHHKAKRSSSSKQQKSCSSLGSTTTHEEFLQCSECGKNFKLQSYLKQHQRIHMRDKPHHCSQCGKSFTRPSHLKLHLRIHTGERPYECSWCVKSFTDQSAAQRHERTHTGEKPYHCPECGMNFTRQSNLRRHQRIHTGKKPYSCPYCGRSFTDQPTLRAHRQVHTGARPYPCSQCGLSFGHQGSLKQHQHVHTGEKPYACSQCGKNFAQKGHLKLHLRIHTGEKPYDCSECGKTFNQMSNFKRHKRIHNGEKPYRCLQCGRSFTQQTTLQLHRRTHTGEKPYRCSECGKSFAHQSTFRIHQRSHTGERPYFCPQCSNSFISLGSLQRHQRVHTGEKPYQCPHCGESFTQSCHLKYHQLSYTGYSSYHCL